MADLTILLVSQTGGGKTTLLGELAEEVWEQSKGKKHLRLYTADPGGYRSIKPHVNVGMVKPVSLVTSNPWSFEWACDGKLPDPKDPSKKWVVDEKANADVGAWAFEGLTSMGTSLLGNIAARAGMGENIGGEKIISVKGDSPYQKGAEGITAGGNNRSHYNLVQTRMRDHVYRTHALPGIVAWTALDRTGEDQEGSQRVIGPRIAGKAMVEEAPSWFTYTLHLVVDVQEGEAPIHRMYVTHHKDESAPGALALANTRQPLLASEKLPPFIEPASLRELFRLLRDQEEEATERLKEKMGMA